VTRKFTVLPGSSGFDAVRDALAALADRIRMRAIAAATLTEPLPSAASQYAFGQDHPLREARLFAEPPPVSEAQAFGAGGFGEAIDFPSAAVGLGTRVQRRDITSTTGSAAAATATAHLRQRALDAEAGRLVVPPHCGLELLDAVDWTDAAISSSAIKRRVAGIRWRYDRRRSVYEQEIALGAM
jgi:hypothetical protein